MVATQLSALLQPQLAEAEEVLGMAIQELQAAAAAELDTAAKDTNTNTQELAVELVNLRQLRSHISALAMLQCQERTAAKDIKAELVAHLLTMRTF